jgi:copper chaperone for superoxide dismutase
LEFEIKDLYINEKENEKLKLNLLQNKGIKSVETNFNEIERKILIETNLPSAVVQKQLEDETNTKAVLRGIGSSRDSISNKMRQTAAVSIISSFDDLIKPIRGVVRFVQLDDKTCAIDGTIDGLNAGYHAINICEYGDISNGCQR